MLATVVHAINFDGVLRNELAPALHNFYSARGDQAGQTLEHLLDDAILVSLQGRHINALKGALHTDGGAFTHFIGNISGVQQCFGGDAPAVQTGTAELVSLNESNGQAQLTGTKRGRVAAAAATEDDDVVLFRFCHRISLRNTTFWNAVQEPLYLYCAMLRCYLERITLPARVAKITVWVFFRVAPVPVPLTAVLAVRQRRNTSPISSRPGRGWKLILRWKLRVSRQLFSSLLAPGSGLAGGCPIWLPEHNLPGNWAYLSTKLIAPATPSRCAVGMRSTGALKGL